MPFGGIQITPHNTSSLIFKINMLNLNQKTYLQSVFMVFTYFTISFFTTSIMPLERVFVNFFLFFINVTNPGISGLSVSSHKVVLINQIYKCIVIKLVLTNV